MILCHHGVSESWPTEFAIDPGRLEDQLRFLLRRGYRPLPLGEALERPPPGRVLAVTFDDAYRSVLEWGLPVLERLGVPATVFVPTAYVGSGEPMAWAEMSRWLGTPFESELECMSWDELRRLRDAGWEIGSHTHTHPDLVSLGEGELGAELRRSREECEREIQRPCRSLAYPFSSFDSRVKRAATAAGYSSALILDSQVAIPRQTMPSLGPPTDPMELLRAGIYRDDGRLRFLAKTSPAVRRARASRLLRGALRLAPGRAGA